MISVCMATYNGEEFIKDQLDSILSQLGDGDEVIISDDGSQDKTLSIIRGFNDRRIKVFWNLSKGIVSNFENAIMNSRGEYIFMADQDDIWCENKIAVVMIDFQEGYDLIVSDCIIFESSTNEILQDSFYSFSNSRKGIVKNIIKNSYIGCCIAFNSKIKNIAVPFPSMIPMHDSWIGINAEIHGKVNFNKAKLIKYRKHFKNASYTSSGISKFSLYKKVFYRVVLVTNLFLKYLTKRQWF